MYISEFARPLEVLAAIDELAGFYNVPNILGQLLADRRNLDFRIPSFFVTSDMESCGSRSCAAAVEGSDSDNGNFGATVLIGASQSATGTLIRVIRNIARAAAVPLSDLSGDSFSFVESSESNPVPYGDPDRFAFRALGGYIAVSRDCRCLDFSHRIAPGNCTPLDLIVFSCAMKFSQRDRLVLFRYNDKGLMACPAFSAGSFEEGSPARCPSDYWNMFGGLLCECRGTVIDLEDQEIASLPFYKFRNLGECPAYSRELVAEAWKKSETVDVSDKMDGSFVQMRYVGDRYGTGLFGKSGVLTTMSGSLNPETNDTLANIYRWVSQLEALGQRYGDMCRDNPDTTFIFEHVRPEADPHIVSYPRDKWNIYMLSARDTATGAILSRSEIERLGREYGIPCTRAFPDISLSDVEEICSTADASEREGFVANLDGWLVKIKLDEFGAISRLVHGSTNFNTVIAAAADGTIDDLLAKIPMEHHGKILPLARELAAFDENMRECVLGWAAQAPQGDPKSAAAFFSENVPKGLFSLIMDAYRNGEARESYLYRNPTHPEPSPLKENVYRERTAMLAEAQAGLSQVR